MHIHESTIETTYVEFPFTTEIEFPRKARRMLINSINLNIYVIPTPL